MSIVLPTICIDTGELLQHVSRVAYRNAPLYYGRDGTNRYDAPARDYGVLYLGRDLPTVLMEPLAKLPNEADFLTGGSGEKRVVRVRPLKA